MTGPMVMEPVLATDERSGINAGRWFSSLSPMLRHDILRHGSIRRYRSGATIAVRGDEPREWWGIARGSVRVGTLHEDGKQSTLAYLEPGIWFGDIAIIEGTPRTHDAHAHGPTTLICVAATDFMHLMDGHAELSKALVRLQTRRLRHLFSRLEDMSALPLRPRLARHLIALTRTFGEEDDHSDSGVRIALPLPQESLARLVGASRQRINQELKCLERESTIVVRRGELVIQQLSALQEAARY